jgi:hypothetical protein
MDRPKKEQLKSIRIAIPVEVHNIIKRRAAFLGMTMKKWILQAALVKIQTEDKYK